ncbi:ankyrin repeat-containing domain protein [Coprinopsis sp. MPI-PUGE-AT-0042]|nr:ankyrin repeat-containing domain protein [Coprinopsis sp. MPI-PUGE-AT-0042]
MFLFWIANGKILWGIGIAGAGKTVLAQPLTVRDVLESFVKQIVERHADLGPLVESLYLLHKRERTKPSQEELQDLLHTFIEPVLLGILATLDAKLFITSRRSSLETLQQQLYQAEVFEIAATPSDLDLYIKDFFRHSPDIMTLLEGTDFEDRIVKAVHQKSGGMFLHAKLQLEALHHCISALDVEETLEGFPTNVEAIYAKTWERILDQGHKRSNLAKLVLLWITHARGEMTIDTLRHAVATCPETHVFEHKRMVPETLLLSACCGLVSVDEKTRLVRLMHYTAQDAILPRILEFFPVPHAILALVCVAHLTSCGLQNYKPDAGAGDEERRDFMVRLSNDPFLAYTHRSWVHHTRQCHNYAPVTAAASEFLLNCTQYPLADQSPIDFGGPLHTSIYKRSPLMLAVQRGHPASANALLSLPSIDVNLSDRYGLNALMHVAHHDHIECVQALVEAPGIDINAVDEDGMTALIHAVQMGQTEAAKILLGLPGIDVNAADREFKGWTALIHAAWEGQTEVVKLLLGVPGICINAVDEAGCSALIHAVREGSTEVVKLLLKAPEIDVNAASTLDGHTALSLAMRRGHREIVDLLLAFPGTIIPLSRDVL